MRYGDGDHERDRDRNYCHGDDYDGHGKYDRIMRGRPTLGGIGDAVFEDDDGDDRDGDDLENFNRQTLWSWQRKDVSPQDRSNLQGVRVLTRHLHSRSLKNFDFEQFTEASSRSI